MAVNNKSFVELFMKDFEKNKAKLAREVVIYINRVVKRKLTNDYLSVNTGQLRNTTNAYTNKDGFVNLTTSTDYGRAYETGNWTGVKSKGIYRKTHKSSASPLWIGKRLRPFMKDTIIEGDRDMERLIERVLKV